MRRFLLISFGVLLLLAQQCSCAETASPGSRAQTEASGVQETDPTEMNSLPHTPEWLSVGDPLEFRYAEGLHIYSCEPGGYLADIPESGVFYLLPKTLAPLNKDQIRELSSQGITVLQTPIERAYMAATSVMSLAVAAGGLDRIRFSSQKADGWYRPEAVSAMEEGKLLFAGKYSEPDYELLLREQCDLAIESTMILHSPKTKEMLERIGIPVLIDRSSYEKHPMGRTEWIRLYGLLFDCLEGADAFFATQEQAMREAAEEESTGKRAAFFYVNAAGEIVVRASSDSIPEMMKLAGGSYVPADFAETSASAAMTMEEFYARASDADILIYNASIDAPIDSIRELLDKNPIFAQFAAVQEGSVWCTSRSLYQAADRTGDLIREFHNIFSGGSENLEFFFRVE